jgi:hypothetical protein
MAAALNRVLPGPEQTMRTQTQHTSSQKHGVPWSTARFRHRVRSGFMGSNTLADTWIAKGDPHGGAL